MKKQSIPTPALLVDIDKLKDNIERMARKARTAGVNLRPHFKSHKAPAIAHMQMKAGAVGISVARLSEAEVLAAAGIDDILVAYPIVGEDKVERLLNLDRLVKISTTVDTLEAAWALSQAAAAREQRIDVLVEVESGYKRCGVEPGESTLTFVREITGLSGLRFKGVMTMAGHIYRQPTRESQFAVAREEAQLGANTAALLRQNGIEVEVISAGSTAAAQFLGEVEGVTEYRPGFYVFNEVSIADLGMCTLAQIAVSVLATVVSVPASDRFIIDAGRKTLSSVPASKTPGYGLFRDLPGVTVSWLCQEHGIVNPPVGVPMPSVGQKLEILPNCVADVVALRDEMYVVQGDEVIATWEIPAHSKR